LKGSDAFDTGLVDFAHPEFDFFAFGRQSFTPLVDFSHGFVVIFLHLCLTRSNGFFFHPFEVLFVFIDFI
jgi:hypothetical protein